MKRLSFVAALALVLTVAIPSAGLAAGHPGATTVRPLARVTVSANDPVPIISIGWSVDPGNSLTRVFGEIQNNSPVPIRNVTLRVRLLDSAKQVLMTATGGAFFDTLNPGDKSVWSAQFHFSAEPADADAVVTDFTVTPDYGNHNINVATGTETIIQGTLFLAVQVTNTNATAIDGFGLSFIFYGTNGLAADAGFVPFTDTLEPGESETVLVGGKVGSHSAIHIYAESLTPPSMAIQLADPAMGPKVGTTVTLRGVASSGDSVNLQELRSGLWADVPGTNVKADSTGAFAIPYKIHDTVVLRAVTPAAQSSPIVIFATPAVTLKASAATILKGKSVTLTGTVSPAFPGTYVTIQRKVGSTWVKVATVALNSSSKFTYKWTPKAKGTYLLSVLMPETDLLFGGRSNTVKVVVK